MWPRRQASHGSSSAAQNSVPTASLVSKTALLSSAHPSLLMPLFTSRESAEKAKIARVKLHNEAESGVDDAAWLLRALDKRKLTKVKAEADKKVVRSLNVVKGREKPQKKSKIDRKGGAYELVMSLKKQQQLWRKGAVKKQQDKAEGRAKDQEREQQETGFDRVFQEVFCDEQGETRGGKNESTSIFCKKTREAAVLEVGLHLAQNEDGERQRALNEEEEEEKEAWGFASAGNDVLNLDDFGAPAGSTEVSPSVFVEATKAAELERWKAEDTQRVVSDNFVRLNMRKRFKGSSGRAKKRPAYLRARNENSLNEATGDNFNGIAPLVDAKGSQLCRQENPLLVDDGVDFIEECLEALAKAEKACGLSAYKTLRSTKRTRETQPLQPPRCYHALVCQILEVKKRNKNHGRRFFACPLALDEGRCDFFLWEDDHVPLALQTLFSAPSLIGSGESAIEATAIESVPLDIEASEEEQRGAMLTNLRLVFGHTDFRPGQQWAISRVLHRQDTLLVLPTGAGKSLCYQFPALFLPGITLVISPLISLMNDQYESLPAPLKARAVCLSGFSGSGSGSSKAKHAAFVRDLLADKLSLIFLSPEKALGAGMQTLLAMPRVRARLALVCVDEAHCISEWSHHFRPSYLRLVEVFRHAQCVLCVTATASRRVVNDVLRQLRSRRELLVAANKVCDDESNMVLQMPWQRKNLALEVRSVSCSEERLRHLVCILPELSKGSAQPSKGNGGGVIVYVHQQRQTEELAALLREQLPSTWRGSSKVMAFHAGMSPEAKEKVRTSFARGRVRVVVATVAFGMGIDKKNVRAVVHFHMPSSVEAYVQQVGRAGRDGKAARALLYLLQEDAVHYRSLLFSTALHRDQLRRLLTLVFLDHHTISAPSNNNHVIAVEYDNQGVGGLTLVSLERDWLERHLDLKAATIETFLTLLALETQRGKKANDDNSLGLRVVLQPLSMSRCTLQVLESQAKKLATRSCAKLLLNAVQRDELPNSRVTLRKDGYLSSWAVDFHLHEAAHWYERTINAHGTVEKNVTTLVSSGAQQDGDTNAAAVSAAANERQMLQELRTAQQTGHIQRLSFCQPAFQIQLNWQVGLSEEMKAEVVERWTNILYAKHEHLESRQLARLAQLYGALHTAALPTPSPTALRQDEKDEMKALEDKALALETKLKRYFDDDDEENDGNEAASGFEDKHLLQQILRPLTSSLIESIERDTSSLVQLRLDGRDMTGNCEAEGHKKADDDTKWTSYAVAKVFHGLPTPQLPFRLWRDHLCWRRYSDVAFEHIVRIANKVLSENQTTNAAGVMGDKYETV